MKLRLLTTIYTAIMLTLVFALAPVSPVRADTVNIIDAVFENTPLFYEANIVPGDSETRFIKVANKVNEAIMINTAAIAVDDPGGLGDMLNLTIKKGVALLYQNTLAAFFNAGSLAIDSLAVGENAQYDYTISFKTQAGNDYQNKILMFDIIINAEASDNAQNPVLPGDPYIPAGSYGSGGYFLYHDQSQISSESGSDDISVRGEAGAPNLTVSKTSPAAFANPGQTGVAYEIIVANNGDLAAYGVSVADTLPEGFYFSGTKERIKVFAVGDLKPGGIKKITYLADVDSQAAPGRYQNKIIVSADNHGPVSATADLDVRRIGVAGAELIPSGFSPAEFFALVIMISLLFGAAFGLRRGQTE